VIRRQFDSSQDHQRDGVGFVGLADFEFGHVLREFSGLDDDFFGFIKARGCGLGWCR
jgi:hypothetical protein